MIKLPSVKKWIGSGLTRFEKVHGLILGIALAAGVGVAGPLPTEAKDIQSSSLSTGISVLGANQKPFILKPSTIAEQSGQTAWHYSHESHSSHYSHESHYSHYSSR